MFETESAPALHAALLLHEHVVLLLYRTARLFDYKRQNFMVRPRIHVLTMKILKAPLPRHPYLQYL